MAVRCSSEHVMQVGPFRTANPRLKVFSTSMSMNNSWLSAVPRVSVNEDRVYGSEGC